MFVGCTNKRKENSPQLVFTKIQSLPGDLVTVNEEGRRLVTKNEHYFVDNYFDSDTSALKNFVKQRLEKKIDTVEKHYSFYIESKEVNINSVTKNPQLIYENENDQLIRRFSVLKNQLIIYYKGENGDFKLRSEKLNDN